MCKYSLQRVIGTLAETSGDEPGAGPVLLYSHPQGCLYHTYTFRVTSASLPRGGIGATLQSAAVGIAFLLSWPQGWLYHLLQEARGGGEEGRSQGHPPHSLTPIQPYVKWGVEPDLAFLGLAHLCPYQQGQLCVLPRKGAGPAFLSVGAGKEEGQLPCQLGL